MGDDFRGTEMEMERRVATEEACWHYVEQVRWPDGFRCLSCQLADAWRMQNGLWLCLACSQQVSLRAATFFQDLPLLSTVWLHAMGHVMMHKNGVSAVGLQRTLELGRYGTASTLLHKLR